MSFLPGFTPDAAVAPDGAAGDEWYTPPWLLAWMPPIDIDPCYSRNSFVRAKRVIDVRDGGDGLVEPWRLTAEAGIAFVNPPFSDTSAWLAKCRSEATNGVVVALVPALPGDGPWHSHVWGHARWVGFIAGRVDFVDPTGRTETKGRGHALIIYAGGRLADLAADIEWCRMRQAAKGHQQEPFWVQGR